MTDWLTEFLDKLTSPLVLFGFAGQAVFMLRFLIQWYVSERNQRSTVPVVFWWISLAGGVMLCTYGVLDRDPVIMLGQGLGLAIYARNLALIYSRRRRIRGRQSERVAGVAAPASTTASERSVAGELH